MKNRQRIHILHLIDGNRGGSQRHLIDLCRSRSPSARHFVFRVTRDAIGLDDAGADRTLAFDATRLNAGDGGWPSVLLRAVDALGIGVIHAHALGPLLAAAEAADRPLERVPYCITLHDLGYIDPRFFVVPRETPHPDPEWIARCAPVLEGARAVIAPSAWLAGIVNAHYPNVTPQVVGNGIGAAPELRVEIAAPWTASSRVYAVVGALGAHKGSELLLEVARSIAEPGIVGVVIGYTETQSNRGWLVPGRLYLHGRYDPDELPALLSAYGCRLAYFPNVVPESFSYVLSEVWQAGLPALVPPSGALAERVRDSGAGWLLAAPRDVGAVARTIEELLSPAGKQRHDQALARVDAAAHSIPDLQSMRESIEAIHDRIATPAGTDIDVDAGWAALRARLREALFANIAESHLDAQWLSAVSEEHRLREWSAKLARDVAALETTAQRMQYQFAECLTRSLRLDADVQQLKARNSRVEGDAAALRERNANFDREIGAVNDRNLALEKELAAVGARNADLDNHVIALRERNARVESDVVELVKRNIQLEGDIVALSQRNLELDTSIIALRERNTLVEADLAAIKQRNARMELDASTLQAELGTTRERLAAIDEELVAQRHRAEHFERALGFLPSLLKNWLIRHGR